MIVRAKSKSSRRQPTAPVIALAPVANAAIIAEAFTGNTVGTVDALTAVAELASQCERVGQGDLRQVEDLLVSQMHSLDVVFASLARRAASNFGQNPQAAECYLKLALRAQNQARATAETLATMKSPPVIFSKQANIAHGHQQVNIGCTQLPARMQEARITPNELLEERDGSQRLDARTTSPSSGSNSALATVGSQLRP